MDVKEKILKIMALCLEINPPEIPCIGQKKTAVFFEWMPHCNHLAIYGYLSGWKKRTERDFKFEVWTDREPKKLDKVIKFLEGTLKGEKKGD